MLCRVRASLWGPRPLAWTAIAGVVLLALALVGSLGRLGPEACTNEFLTSNARGASTERSWVPTGYTCHLTFDDGSTSQVVETSWLPVVALPLGTALVGLATAGLLPLLRRE